DVLQVPGIEPDLHLVADVLHGHLVFGLARDGVIYDHAALALGELERHGATPLTGYRRNAVGRGRERRAVEGCAWIVRIGWDDALVIWERSVDQLRGQHQIAHHHPDLVLRNLEDHGLFKIHEAFDLADGLPRDDDSLHTY